MEFPEHIVARVTARQGKLHPYDVIEARSTAFVIVDMQNYFTQPGFMAECPPARATFGAVNKLARAIREAGGLVVWIQTCSDGAEEFWSHHHGKMMTPERSARRLLELGSGHAGYELSTGLEVHPEDTRVVKRTFSALAPGSSSLDELLKSRGIETVLIGGVATNVCCESTARDSMMMDYATIMVDDALSAMTTQEHEQSLHNWMLFFGDVLTTDEVISRLRPAA